MYWVYFSLNRNYHEYLYISDSSPPFRLGYVQVPIEETGQDLVYSMVGVSLSLVGELQVRTTRRMEWGQTSR